MCAGRRRVEVAAPYWFALVDGPRYARYVGRVGVLAIALGVGVAVATGQGVPIARADNSSAASDSTSGPSATDGTTAGHSTAASDTKSGAATTTSTTSTSVADQPSAGTTGSATDVKDAPSVPEMKVTNSGGALTSEHHQASESAQVDDDTAASAAPNSARSEPTAPAAEPSSTPTPEPEHHAVPDITPATHDAPEPAAANDDPPVQSTHVQRLAVAKADENDAATMSTSPAPMAFSTISARSLAVAVAPAPVPDAPYTNVVQALVALPGTIVAVAASFVAAVLAPFFASGPTAPAQPPLLWAVLGWVRREFQHSFFNQTPHAVGDALTTSEDIPKVVDVLANDSDDDELSVTSFSQGAHGAVALNTDGTLTYTPDGSWTGTDTFTYTASDINAAPHIHGLLGLFTNAGHSATGTVTVTVTAANRAPTANPDTDTAIQSGPTIVGNVLINDTDPDVGDILTVTDPRTTTTTLGTLALNANGNYTYEPTFGATGHDVFSYTITDTAGATSTTTLTVTIAPPNHAPTGADTLTIAVDELTPASGNLITATGASDPDGDDLTVTVTGNGAGQYGNLVVDGQTGEYTYTADNLGNGTFTDSFAVTVADGRGGSFESALDVVVTGHDRSFPNPGTIHYTTDEDSSVSGNLFDWVSEPDGDALHVVVSNSLQTLQYGTLLLNPDTGVFTYTPHVDLAAGQTLDDTVTYTIDDRHATHRSGTLRFTITGVDDATRST